MILTRHINYYSNNNYIMTSQSYELMHWSAVTVTIILTAVVGLVAEIRENIELNKIRYKQRIKFYEFIFSLDVDQV